MSASDNNNTDITIPCEICNRQVLFEDYLRHSQRCLEVRETRNRMYLNTINRMRERDIICICVCADISYHALIYALI